MKRDAEQMSVKSLLKWTFFEWVCCKWLYLVEVHTQSEPDTNHHTNPLSLSLGVCACVVITVNIIVTLIVIPAFSSFITMPKICHAFNFACIEAQWRQSKRLPNHTIKVNKCDSNNSDWNKINRYFFSSLFMLCLFLSPTSEIGHFQNIHTCVLKWSITLRIFLIR